MGGVQAKPKVIVYYAWPSIDTSIARCLLQEHPHFKDADFVPFITGITDVAIGEEPIEKCSLEDEVLFLGVVPSFQLLRTIETYNITVVSQEVPTEEPFVHVRYVIRPNETALSYVWHTYMVHHLRQDTKACLSVKQVYAPEWMSQVRNYGPWEQLMHKIVTTGPNDAKLTTMVKEMVKKATHDSKTLPMPKKDDRLAHVAVMAASAKVMHWKEVEGKVVIVEAENPYDLYPLADLLFKRPESEVNDAKLLIARVTVNDFPFCYLIPNDHIKEPVDISKFISQVRPNATSFVMVLESSMKMDFTQATPIIADPTAVVVSTKVRLSPPPSPKVSLSAPPSPLIAPEIVVVSRPATPTTTTADIHG